jgi:hypothetical protein
MKTFFTAVWFVFCIVVAQAVFQTLGGPTFPKVSSMGFPIQSLVSTTIGLFLFWTGEYLINKN